MRVYKLTTKVDRDASSIYNLDKVDVIDIFTGFAWERWYGAWWCDGMSDKTETQCRNESQVFCWCRALPTGQIWIYLYIGSWQYAFYPVVHESNISKSGKNWTVLY